VATTHGAFTQMPLERYLIVFSRVSVKLSRIEQWEVSANHSFSQIPAPYRSRRIKRPLAAGRGVVIQEPSLIVSARLKEPKLVADLFLVPSYSPTHRL